MELICRVVNIRRLGGEKAIDLLWRADDGSVLRDDGATEIPDQINVPLDTNDDEWIEAQIEKKRVALYEALAMPGVGITIAEMPMFINQDLLNREL